MAKTKTAAKKAAKTRSKSAAAAPAVDPSAVDPSAVDPSAAPVADIRDAVRAIGRALAGLQGLESGEQAKVNAAIALCAKVGG
jgi:hypothetical protein